MASALLALAAAYNRLVTGGIVLAGGRSQRMGRDKASLDWHGVPLLAHVCTVVRRGIGGGPVVVVRAPGGALPVLPGWVRVTEDAETGIGPMQGLLDGVRALASDVETVFLASTDAPLLRPAYVEAILGILAADRTLDAAIPFVRGHRHPLLAAYRASALPRLERGLAQGQRRAGQIFDTTLRLVEEDALLAHDALRRQDPGLRSVEDADTPDRYEEARAVPLPLVTLDRAGERLSVRAVRLGQVAEAAGVPVSRLRLEGQACESDALLPLADGDVVVAS